MYISIIIPTYKDWERLSLCLNALNNQTIPKDQFEIIVVNNNPSDSPPDQFFFPENCRLIVEKKPGSYAARNSGLQIASGKIIGFTDSDCIPDKDWIKNATLFFSNNKDCSRIAGRIELFYKSNHLTTAELYEKVYAFKQDFAASIGSCVTGNMFTYKHVFEYIGPFRDDLLSGGDHEWSLRAQKRNFKIVYCENVLIKHPARLKMSELVKKSKRTGAYFGKSKMTSTARFFKYLIPPVNSLWHGTNLLIKERLIVFSVRYYLNFIRGFEELRLSFGKQGERQ